MIDVRFPEPEFRIRKNGDEHSVFDTIRKKWLRLTDEEWVRQNFLAYVQHVCHYPVAYISLEKEIQLFDLRKRFDILVFDKEHQPWMLVECKAPGIPLQEEALLQALRYNISIPVSYLIITNGTQTRGWKIESEQLAELQALPTWSAR